MINVELKTKEKTIRQRINDWKELEDLLLKYKNYTSLLANEQKEETINERRHTK